MLWDWESRAETRGTLKQVKHMCKESYESFEQNPTPWFGEGVVVNEIGNSIFVALDF